MNTIRIYLIVACLCLSITACEKKDCFTPPAPVVFEFVDAEGKNLITTGQLHKDNFELREELGNRENELVEYKIREDDRVLLPEVGWSEGVIQYKFLSTIKSFSFLVKARKNKACGGTIIEQITLDGVEYEQKEGYILVILERE
ncbi:hypothetical protein [Sphingobacterium chuzhouense]|uniref:Lipoprotein n=1 Tax=Sphingobacterium chuzhouense TaxID=1742264 RepID=A0ABR7XU01_9SPHI|nr:hypothetical protein [Sphingobacterium chuzhouense]MBD1422557.1 hypothetical protein [Sphingobacterium chuzhouense]